MTSLPFTRRGFGAALGAGLALPSVLRAQDGLSIAAINYPLAYYAERIGAGLATVNYPVPAGTDPSFWRPSISEIGAIQSADLILLNGASFADWTERTSLPRSRVVRSSAAFDGNFISTATVTHSHGDGGSHSHTGTASYVWMDFGQATQQAITIANAMIRKAGGSEAAIRENLDGLLNDLEALDTQALAVGAAASDVVMIASHPRYQYFARAYGLDIAAVEWDIAAPPSEDQWAELDAKIAATGARVFLWESEAPDPAAMARIEALGLVNVVFPPMANRPEQGDFLSVMQASVTALGAAVESL